MSVYQQKIRKRHSKRQKRQIRYGGIYHEIMKNPPVYYPYGEWDIEKFNPWIPQFDNKQTQK